MESLNIQGSYRNPTLILDVENGIIEIKGRSILENHHKYFSTFIESVKQYLDNPQPNTIVNINLEYFDSRSSKVLIIFLKTLDKLYNTSNKVVVNWYYESDDADIEDMINDYQQFLNTKINPVVIS